MNPYGVAQSYCEAPSKDWVVIEPTSYVEPIAYVVSALEPAQDQYDSENVLTFVQEVSGYATSVNDFNTYGVPFAYAEGVPYIGNPEIEKLYVASNLLTFSEEAKTDYEASSDNLTFIQDVGVIHDASNTLVWSQPTYQSVSDVLTFSQTASITHAVSNNLTFVEEITIFSAGTDLLTFVGTANYVHNAVDTLTFSENVDLTALAENILTFSESAGPTYVSENILSFTEQATVAATQFDTLTFTQEATAISSVRGALEISFLQEASWSKIHGASSEGQLSINEIITYTITRNGQVVGSGGSGYVPNPVSDRIIAHLDVGGHIFRMANAYKLEMEFSNGVYLNGGAKYALSLGRPLNIVGDWQLTLNALIGTQQTVTNLLADPFEVFISDESVLTGEGMELVLYALEHDTRGVI